MDLLFIPVSFISIHSLPFKCCFFFYDSVQNIDRYLSIIVPKSLFLKQHKQQQSDKFFYTKNVSNDASFAACCTVRLCDLREHHLISLLAETDSLAHRYMGWIARISYTKLLRDTITIFVTYVKYTSTSTHAQIFYYILYVIVTFTLLFILYLSTYGIFLHFENWLVNAHTISVQNEDDSRIKVVRTLIA